MKLSMLKWVIILGVSALLLSCDNQQNDKKSPKSLSLNQHYNTQEDTPISFSPIPLTSDITLARIGQPQHGVLVNQGGGTFSYEPENNYNGEDGLIFQLSDGRQGDIRFSITPVNDQPVAVDDLVILDSLTSLIEIPVLENDRDKDQDPLTLESFQSNLNAGISIQNKTSLQIKDAIATPIKITYTVSDGKASAQASVTVVLWTDLLPEIGSLTIEAERTSFLVNEVGRLFAMATLKKSGVKLNVSSYVNWSADIAGVVDLVNDPVNGIVNKGAGRGGFVAISSGRVAVNAQLVNGTVTINADTAKVITVRPSPPDAIKIIQQSETSVLVDWKLETGLRYNLYIKPLSGEVKVIPNLVTAYSHINLKPGESYFYWVTAVSAGGESRPTAQLNYQVIESFIDLVITEAKVMSNSTVSEGELIDVVFTVKNQGTVASANNWTHQFKVGLLLDPDPNPRGIRLLYQHQGSLLLANDDIYFEENN